MDHSLRPYPPRSSHPLVKLTTSSRNKMIDAWNLWLQQRARSGYPLLNRGGRRWPELHCHILDYTKRHTVSVMPQVFSWVH
jgi:hypothetical protein